MNFRISVAAELPKADGRLAARGQTHAFSGRRPNAVMLQLQRKRRYLSGRAKPRDWSDSLKTLVLQSNFRSQQPVVDWVNAAFANAFPSQSDISREQTLQPGRGHSR